MCGTPRLVKESQAALTNCNKGRAEIHKTGRRGSDAENELRALQATYAKAWVLPQYHLQDCEVCQVLLISERVRSEVKADTLCELYTWGQPILTGGKR